MKRLLWPWMLLVVACGGPLEPTGPFVKVTMLAPNGFVAPSVELLSVSTSAVLDGSPISNTNEIPLSGDELPTSFVIRFSEPVRGSVVNFDIQGLQSGVSVYSVQTSAVADVSEIEVVVSFCGDQAIDPARSETCDDGPGNSDNIPNACRSNCQAASCGDGVLDNNEFCDDGNNSDADGCEADCSLPACDNGILDPEDFTGSAPCFLLDITKQTAGQPTDIVALDLNQDNQTDLVTGIGNEGLVGVLLGDDVLFSDEVTTVSQTGAGVVVVGDLLGGDILGNPDSLVDIASAVGAQPGFSVFRNQSTLPFAETPNPGASLTDILVGDFTGDGKDEVLQLGSELSVVLPNSDRDGFEPAQNTFFVPTAGLSVQVGSLLLGDWNGDSIDDVAVFEFNSSITQVSVLLGGASLQNVEQAQAGAQTFAFFRLISSAALDTNNDSNQDIVLLDAVGQRVFFFLGDGTGQLANPTSVALSVAATSLLTEDFDQDGLQDLALLNNVTEKSVTILLQKEAFLIEHKIDIASIVSPFCFAAGDFNQDSFPDLAVGGGVFGSTGEVSVLLFTP